MNSTLLNQMVPEREMVGSGTIAIDFESHFSGPEPVRLTNSFCPPNSNLPAFKVTKFFGHLTLGSRMQNRQRFGTLDLQYPRFRVTNTDVQVVRMRQ